MFKRILAVLFLVSSVSFAAPEVRETKIELFPFSKYLARPEFAAALLEANQKASGWKSRVMYSKEPSTRLMRERIRVIVVGKTERPNEHWYKSEFALTAINSGFAINVSPVTTTEISEKEFVEFEQ